jgi:hypothetical protein
MNRIQRLRKKGYRHPDNTKYVGRPGKFGNPFKLVGSDIFAYNSASKKWINWSHSPMTIYDLIELYETWLLGGLTEYAILATPPTEKEIAQLAKYDNLSCFCSKEQPCHVDVLIKHIENMPICENCLSPDFDKINENLDNDAAYLELKCNNCNNNWKEFII